MTDDFLELEYHWTVDLVFLGWPRVLSFGLHTDFRRPVAGVIVFGWMLTIGKHIKHLSLTTSTKG